MEEANVVSWERGFGKEAVQCEISGYHSDDGSKLLGCYAVFW